MRPPTEIEKIALDLISKHYSPENFSKAVKQNINLTDLIVSNLGIEWVRAIRAMVSLYKVLTNDGNILNAKNVLNWLDLTNPSLTQKIRETQENYFWFKKQVTDIKRLFGI